MIASVLFWFGVIGTVREWRFAKKLETPIARREKGYLAGGVVLAFAVSITGDMISVSDDLIGLFGTRTTFPFLLAVALIVWAARQMLRRARPAPSP